MLWGKVHFLDCAYTDGAFTRLVRQVAVSCPGCGLLWQGPSILQGRRADRGVQPAPLNLSQLFLNHVRTTALQCPLISLVLRRLCYLRQSTWNSCWIHCLLTHISFRKRWKFQIADVSLMTNDSVFLLIRRFQRNEHLIWTFKLPETLTPNKKIIAFPDKFILRREYFENSYFPSSSCDFLLKFMCHIHKLPHTFTKTRSKQFLKRSLLKLINIQWTTCV